MKYLYIQFQNIFKNIFCKQPLNIRRIGWKTILQYKGIEHNH